MRAPLKVLVTGGSRGIGLAIAKRLATEHGKVLITARNGEELATAASAISSTTTCDVQACSVDFADPENAARLTADWVKSKLSALDVLVLNAGMYVEGSLAEVGKADFHTNMNVNLTVNHHLVQALLPLLKSGTAPRIVIIGSTAAYEPYAGLPTYGVAKWALRGYALNLRRELMKENIGVTFVAPGGTLTSMWEGVELPANRLLDPDDIGKLVAASIHLSEQAVVEELIVRPILGDMHE